MYPMMVDISKRKVVVVGGGRIATRKLQELIRCGAQPTVVAPAVSPEILEWAESSKVLLDRRAYKSGDLDDAILMMQPSSSSARMIRLQIKL